MKRNITLILVATAMLMLAAGPAMAGAFRIPEAGAKAMGFANAFTGMADDPSAVQFNPAGITQLEGTQIYTGLTYVGTSNDYKDEFGNKTDAEEQSFFPPHAYYTNHLGDGNWWFGLGIVAPFGLGTEWDVTTFEYIATDSLIEMVKINPVAAVKVNDKLSLAFGVDYYTVLTGELENSAAVAVTAGVYAPGDQKLEADGDGYGFNVGLLAEISDALSLGFAYRSATEVELDGDIKIFVPAVSTTIKSSGNADLKLPDTAALGLSWKPGSNWTINFDLDWTGWSEYDELVVKSGLGTIAQSKDYDDKIAYRVGAEYQLNDNWSLRGGLLTEEMPIPDETYDPRVPDGDRLGFSIGTGYTKDAWTIDVAYMYVDFDEVKIDENVSFDPGTPGFWPGGAPPTQTVDGKYEGNINLVGVSLGYRF